MEKRSVIFQGVIILWIIYRRAIAQGGCFFFMRVGGNLSGEFQVFCVPFLCLILSNQWERLFLCTCLSVLLLIDLVTHYFAAYGKETKFSEHSYTPCLGNPAEFTQESFPVKIWSVKSLPVKRYLEFLPPRQFDITRI